MNFSNGFVYLCEIATWARQRNKEQRNKQQRIKENKTMSAAEPRRGRKPKYSKESVIAAAVEHADEFGLEEVTMAKVANKLGCTPMALYSHIENHETLLREMANSALADLDGDFEDFSDWKKAVSQWLNILWQTSLSRPWVVEVILVNDQVMPQWLKFNGKLGTILKNAGMGDKETADCLMIIGCIAVSVVYQSIKFPLPRSTAIDSGLVGNLHDKGIDFALFSALAPHFQAQSNEAFHKEIEHFLLVIFEAKLNQS